MKKIKICLWADKHDSEEGGIRRSLERVRKNFHELLGRYAEVAGIAGQYEVREPAGFETHVYLSGLTPAADAAFATLVDRRHIARVVSRDEFVAEAFPDKAVLLAEARLSTTIYSVDFKSHPMDPSFSP